MQLREGGQKQRGEDRGYREDDQQFEEIEPSARSPGGRAGKR